MNDIIRIYAISKWLWDSYEVWQRGLVGWLIQLLMWRQMSMDWMKMSNSIFSHKMVEAYTSFMYSKMHMVALHWFGLWVLFTMSKATPIPFMDYVRCTLDVRSASLKDKCWFAVIWHCRAVHMKFLSIICSLKSVIRL